MFRQAHVFAREATRHEIRRGLPEQLVILRRHGRRAASASAQASANAAKRACGAAANLTNKQAVTIGSKSREHRASDTGFDAN